MFIDTCIEQNWIETTQICEVELGKITYQNNAFVSERLGHSIFPPLYDASYSLIFDINRAFREAGFKVSCEQFLILSGIQIGYGDSQNKLADFLGRDKSIVSRLLSILEKNGYVVRQSADIDKRRNTLTITKKAKKDWKMMEQIAFKVIQARCQNVDSEKLSICKDVLAQLFINCRPDQVFYSQKSDES